MLQAGFRSFLAVPLFSRGEVIGVLHIRSKAAMAYAERDLRLAERIGEQIAGAIANALLFSEVKKAQEEIREMSLRDQLTGLYNRRGFITLAEQRIREANRGRFRMQLVFIDVDDMKKINDTLGHKAGDQALTATATVLGSTFRESDIVARIGGDEFAVMTVVGTEEARKALSRRLRRNVDAWNGKPSRPFKLSLSWGASLYDPEVPVSLDQLMSEADRLMYLQKKVKGNISRSTIVPS
jgi:diguanylate cyclase (GGDEF)-like protein